MPVFQFRHIKELYPMMWKKAVALTEGVKTQISENAHAGEKLSGTIEVNHWANKVTMDIIGVAGLGREFNALRNSDDELIQNYEEILEPTMEKVIYFALQILGPAALVTNLPWKVHARFKATTSALIRICGELVQEKKELIRRNEKENLDILSVLIRFVIARNIIYVFN